ncbi:MAG: DUF4258 domain-containing protein [Agriterribacter sp.]
MKRSRYSGFLVVLLLIAGIAFWYYNRSPHTGSQDIHTADDGSFNRNLTPIIYTRHARCRMGCRHIDESEVLEILHNGKINYHKSDLNSKPDPKYALEGFTHDNQEVRIIFAPSPKGMVVITCIDVKEEWQCNCR